MLIQIPRVLSPSEVKECFSALQAADYKDGRETAGYLSRRVIVIDTPPVRRALLFARTPAPFYPSETIHCAPV